MHVFHSLRWLARHYRGTQGEADIAIFRQGIALVASAGEEGCTNWSTPDGGVPVPIKSTAVFDFVYHVHGRPYTDDNAGSWYLAQPE